MGAANTVVYGALFKNEFRKINHYVNIQAKTVDTDVPEVIPQQILRKAAIYIYGYNWKKFPKRSSVQPFVEFYL